MNLRQYLYNTGHHGVAQFWKLVEISLLYCWELDCENNNHKQSRGAENKSIAQSWLSYSTKRPWVDMYLDMKSDKSRCQVVNGFELARPGYQSRLSTALVADHHHPHLPLLHHHLTFTADFLVGMSQVLFFYISSLFSSSLDSKLKYLIFTSVLASVFTEVTSHFV